jgi:hypothetical protein
VRFSPLALARKAGSKMDNNKFSLNAKLIKSDLREGDKVGYKDINLLDYKGVVRGDDKRTINSKSLILVQWNGKLYKSVVWISNLRRVK